MAHLAADIVVEIGYVDTVEQQHRADEQHDPDEVVAVDLLMQV